MNEPPLGEQPHDPAVSAAERAMSDAFRRYTGTPVGQEMWNLNMERTWALVAPAAVDAARPHVEAAALRTAADAFDVKAERLLGSIALTWVAEQLRERADMVEQKARQQR